MELAALSFDGDKSAVLGLFMCDVSSRGVLITSNDEVSLEIEFRVFSSNLGSDLSLSLSSTTSISSELSRIDV